MLAEGLEKAKSDHFDRLLEIIRKLPPDIIAQRPVANAIVEFWRKPFVRSLSERRYLDIWDHVWNAVAKDASGEGEKREAVSYAINNPAGRLTEEILGYLWPKDAKVGGGLPLSLTKRLQAIVGRSDHKTVDASSVIVASRLEVLHAVQPQFAQQFVLPLLSWSKNPSAAAYWSGFLWPARVSPDLYKQIETDLIAALKKPGLFKDHSYKVLCQIFVLASMEFKAPKPSTVRVVMDDLSSTGLSNASDFIRQRMLNSKENAGGYWGNTVKPWLADYWPRDVDKKTAATFADFTMIAVYTNSSFPKALLWLEENGFLGEIPTETVLLYSLTKSDKLHEDFKGSSTLPERFPKDVLHLLWIARPFRWDRTRGREILTRIAVAAPELTISAEYQELDELLPR